MLHQECSGSVYPEVEALTQLMQYKTSNAGCCKVRGGGGGAGLLAVISAAAALVVLHKMARIHPRELPHTHDTGAAPPSLGHSGLPRHHVHDGALGRIGGGNRSR